jgi:hypothetical protein
MRGINLDQGGLLADLARVNVRYLLEWRQSGTLRAAVSLPLPPSAISYTTPTAPLITYTLSGEPLRELAPIRARTININGSAGHTARSGYTRNGALTVAEGGELLREFRAFIENYQEEAAYSPTTYTDNGAEAHHELIFRALDEDYHARVEVASLTIDRDAQSSHTAPAWSLQLIGYGEPDIYARPFNDYQSALENLTESIRLVSAAGAVAAQALSGLNTLARLALRPLEALGFISAALSEALESVGSLADIPADAVGRLANTASGARLALTRLSADLERFPSENGRAWEALKRALLGADEAATQAERAVFIAGRPTPTDTATEQIISPLYSGDTLSDPAPAPAITYRLLSGESLRTLARRVYGEADRWPELASFNGWPSPHHTASGRPARAGDLVLIPQAPELTPPSGDFYGEDLALSPAGDLIFRDGDLSTISGPPNLEQALNLRARTVQGELTHAPRYGLPRAIGRRVTNATSGHLAAVTREQITADARIDRLSRFDLQTRGDQIHIELEAIAADGSIFSPSITR